jgi:uncharacterized protein YjbI with pentapeptide repeats
LSGILTLIVAQQRRLFSQSLDLPGERLVEPDEEKLKKLEVTLLLSGGRDLREANFANTDLRKADLRNADLSRTVLSFARLSGARLSYAILKRAHLFFAHLEGADLSGAHLERADLTEAHLERADLRWAYLEGASLLGAHLEGADLTEVAAGLTQAQIEVAFGDAATKLPKDLTRPARWTAPPGGGAAPAKP